MTETELKTKVLAIAYERGWKVYHVPHGRIPNGGGAGYPDLTLARDGRVLWIELKQDAGVLSREQMLWMHELANVHVIRPRDYELGIARDLLS